MSYIYIEILREPLTGETLGAVLRGGAHARLGRRGRRHDDARPAVVVLWQLVQARGRPGRGRGRHVEGLALDGVAPPLLAPGAARLPVQARRLRPLLCNSQRSCTSRYTAIIIYGGGVMWG